MRLNKAVKLVLGALTLWPPLYLFVFMAFVMTSFFWMHQAQGAEDDLSPRFLFPFAFLFVAHFATILMTFALAAFYLVFLFKTDRVPEEKKALWAVVLFLAGMGAMPVFFYLYIWPETWPTDAPAPPEEDAPRA